MALAVLGLFWLFCGWLALTRRPLAALAGAIVLLPFGSISVVPPQVAGGLTVLPRTFLPLLAACLFAVSRPGWRFLMATAFSPSRLGLVTAVWGVAAISALVYPRIFAGQVEVVPMRGSLQAIAGGWQLLGPSPQNITQLGYFTISLSLVFLFAFAMQYHRYQQVILKALFTAGTIAIVTGVLDLANQYVNLSFLLDPFRTASYRLLVDHDVGVIKRVVGLMPEASFYGTMCVGLGVLLVVWKDAFESPRLRTCITFGVAPLLFVCGFLSTSSSAYLAIGAAGAALGLRWTVGLLRADRSRRRLSIFWPLAALGLIAGLIAAYALVPHTFEPVIGLVDRMVFQKTGSDSFEQRMAWNAVSLQALVDTYGIGVGIGGTRTSSWPVSVASSIGIPGVLLLLGFAAYVILHRKTFVRDSDRVLCQGGLWALIPLLASSGLTATTPSLSLGLAMILGTHAAFGAARIARTRSAATMPAAEAVGGRA